MISFAVAFALLLHVFFWGAGAAVLAMPARWRRFWPVLVFPAAFALQSLVVWLGAYAGLAGTNRYAWLSELVPATLLAIALWRGGVRRFVGDLGRFGLVWLTVAGATLLTVLPVAIASRGLTSLSLGSCDAADYAAGARVFMEFARSDRTGFLGLTEVVRVMSADNFYDFWLQLNHFTPSALIALNGSILHCAPHELTTLLTIVVHLATIPTAFWVARALFGYSGAASLVIAAVYGINPIPWYSIAQVSPAPLLAANAIALLTWAGVALWNGRWSRKRGVGFGVVLLIAYALILGSYNFILLVSLAPAVAYAGSRAWLLGAWSKFGRWILAMLVPLAVAGLVFWDRVAGLIERFRLFQTYDFGWRIPMLGPEGWLGMVAGGTLHAWSWGGFRWLLALVVVSAFAWALNRSIARGMRRVWLMAAVMVPVLAGYTFLEVRGIVRGTNASYDAFKLLMVFYPLLFAAMCWWITLRWSSRLLEWLVVAALAVIVIGFNLIASTMTVVQMSRPPLIVDGELRQLRKVEAMADVASVNLMITDMWSRLWANEFLLRKPQYFATHTYEGRLNTPLRGEWDLVGDIVRVRPPGAAGREITPHFALVDTRSPLFLRASKAQGWHPEERLHAGDRWCWTEASAGVQIDNPHDQPIAVRVVLDGRGYGDRDVSVAVAGSRPSGFVHLGEARSKVSFPPVIVPPGRSTLVLQSRQPAVRPDGDVRSLAICVFGLVIEPQPVASPALSPR